MEFIYLFNVRCTRVLNVKYVCGRVGAGENVRECESETEEKTEIFYVFIYAFLNVAA